MLTRLPHRIVIQTETRTLFEGGAYTTSWTTSSIEWANVQPINASESYGAEKKQEHIKYSVIMRYISSLTNKNRILYNSQVLQIESTSDPTNRNRMMEVICKQESIR